MPKLDISVCVLALNEEKNLKECLESVKDWAGEIIVGVDDQTSDRTLKIAQSFTKKAYLLPHKELFNINKQKVTDKAVKKWVLWLDADEKVSPELAEEIKNTIKRSDLDSYQMPRKNYIFNKWIQYTGWYPDYQLRLWKKGKVKWPCKSVHEDPMVSGKTEKLTNHLIHSNYTSVSQYLLKLNRYTSLDAKRRKSEFKDKFVVYFVSRPIEEFVKRFVALKGYKDGLHGLALSLLQAFYELVVVIKVWELHKFKDEETDVLKQVKKEGVKVLKSFNWWKRELKINQTANQLKKTWYKGLRKLGV